MAVAVESLVHRSEVQRVQVPVSGVNGLAGVVLVDALVWLDGCIVHREVYGVVALVVLGHVVDRQPQVDVGVLGQICVPVVGLVGGHCLRVEPVGGADRVLVTRWGYHVLGEGYVPFDGVVEDAVEARWPLQHCPHSVVCWYGDLVPVDVVVPSADHSGEDPVAVCVHVPGDVYWVIVGRVCAIGCVGPAAGE